MAAATPHDVLDAPAFVELTDELVDACDLADLAGVPIVSGH